jgi:hypothetical protein
MISRHRDQLDPVPLAGIAGCTAVPFADPTPDDGWTNSFDDIKCYDSLYVQAVLNRIDGYNHERTRRVGVPALFGTNFQAASVTATSNQQVAPTILEALGIDPEELQAVQKEHVHTLPFPTQR